MSASQLDENFSLSNFFSRYHNILYLIICKEKTKRKASDNQNFIAPTMDKLQSKVCSLPPDFYSFSHSLFQDAVSLQSSNDEARMIPNKNWVPAYAFISSLFAFTLYLTPKGRSNYSYVRFDFG